MVFLIFFDVYFCAKFNVKRYDYHLIHYFIMIYIVIYLLYTVIIITYKFYTIYLWKTAKLYNELINVKLYSSLVSILNFVLQICDEAKVQE